MQESKEEKAIVIDFLPHGYPLERQRLPIAQAIGISHFTLLELVPRKGAKFTLKEEVYIGPERRDKVYFIRGRLPKTKLTETAKLQLRDFVEKVVAERESFFIAFLNSAGPLSTRLHQLELLPGLGKKSTAQLLEEREKRPFSSYAELRTRLKGLPDIKKILEKRLYEELTEEVRYKLFAA